jgi:Proline dehydrogenase
MRRLLLWMARNTWMRRNIPKLWFARRAVRKFMPGESAEDALTAAAKFQDLRIPVIFTRLGENLTRIEDADATASAYHELMAAAHERAIPAEPSVKLTQIGFDIDVERTLAHAQALADQAAAHDPNETLWIDMEGSDYTESTLVFYERLKKTHPNTGLCLQAYLKRTAGDVERLLPLAPKIRLVKGAYKESREIAYQSRKDVDANYLALCVAMLTHVKDGRDLFLGMGTHDVRLIEQVAAQAEQMGLARSSFDVEMLYGIRADQQRRLKAEGYSVRVLIAYGDYWYPWYMRRLAERPANVIFALRQLLP